jgi:hypothetical protein
MSTAREKTFLCSFATRSQRITLRVIAWDERAAAQIFREELLERGLSGRGEITVRPAVRTAPVSTEVERQAS